MTYRQCMLHDDEHYILEGIYGSWNKSKQAKNEKVVFVVHVLNVVWNKINGNGMEK